MQSLHRQEKLYGALKETFITGASKSWLKALRCVKVVLEKALDGLFNWYSFIIDLS